MKKTILLLLSIVLSFTLFAQEEDEYKTIGGSGKVRVSGFAGPTMLFTQIGNDFAHMMGGGGGVIINNFFATPQ